ncbi:hypothetical protein CsSME_00002985 [Camellia sinensis var. sinensis]
MKIQSWNIRKIGRPKKRRKSRKVFSKEKWISS